jgi:hypothetical protein
MLLVVTVDGFLPALAGASFLGAVLVATLLIKISFEEIPLIFFQPHREAWNPVCVSGTDNVNNELPSQTRKAG